MTVNQLIEKLKEHSSSGHGELEVKFNDTIKGFIVITITLINPDLDEESFIQLS